jgi:predicted AAA+ superfamily ATPase
MTGKTTPRTFFGRENELQQLSEFLRAPGSGFLHLRGRRRVGKSWLLMELQGRSGGFYFQGEQDSTTKQLQTTMAAGWDEYVGQKNLSLIRQRDLTWDRIFSAITDHARLHPDRTFLLMFDEIHWIARRNSGFVSKVKRAWLSWEKTGNIKVIICGSSNRFFDDKTGTACSILRGLRTHSDIWVRPFSLGEVQRYYFPEWSDEEICLVYMMAGGVPYYLNQIPAAKNFINSINKAFFTSSTIFFDELDEVINLEFNKSSKTRVRKILAALGQEGKTTAAISRSTGIPESSVHETVDKLVDYGLVFEKTLMGASPKKNRAGSRYYMRDFYLNFYFQVLDGLEPRVKDNKRSNIFAALLSSREGYYIPGFSGLAFELLIESVIDCRASSTMGEGIFDKLGIPEKGYAWGHYWEQGATQVDLVVESSQDRESRVLEAKWIARKADVTRGYLEQVRQKSYTPPRGFRLSFYLVMSKPPTKGLRDAARDLAVQIVGLEDLL